MATLFVLESTSTLLVTWFGMAHGKESAIDRTI
jgi:hypothetical protein